MKKFSSILALLLCSISTFAQTKFTRVEDVIYGRKFGMNLTLDVFQPEKANGFGVIWIVSGGFFSAHENIHPHSYEPLLARGYTVFAVVHGSQPKFIISEIQLDIHRAVRFVRHHAARFGINAQRIGLTGASAGGHLSLSVGTQGHPGNPRSSDPVERESSEVQAVACFYPPTDFLNWSRDGEDAVGFGPTIKHQAAFGPESFSAVGRKKLGREISPIHFVTAKMAPTLVIHGDADQVVPLYQAKRFQTRCQEMKAPFKLVIKPGADHGWPGMEKDVKVFADWFDEHLRMVDPVEQRPYPGAGQSERQLHTLPK